MKDLAKKIISVSIIIILAVILFVFAAPLFKRVNFWQRLGFESTARQQVYAFSEILEQRNISELETASFYTELVFPFDFLAESYPTTYYAWRQLRDKAQGDAFTPGSYRTGLDAVNLNSLNDNERKNYLFMDAIKVWIDLTGRDNSGSNYHINIENPLQYTFLLKVKASAGFDLSGNDWFHFSEAEQIVTISLPDPKILNMSVLVDTSEPWPDVVINPFEFGRLLSLLEREFIRDMVWEPIINNGTETGLSIIARENGERIITKMFPKNLNVVISEGALHE